MPELYIGNPNIFKAYKMLLNSLLQNDREKIFMYICMYVCIYVCEYMCIYMHWKKIRHVLKPKMFLVVIS